MGVRFLLRPNNLVSDALCLFCGLLETEWVKTDDFSRVDSAFKGLLVNFAVTSSRHVERMPKSIKMKRLRDSYRLPGFHPALAVLFCNTAREPGNPAHRSNHASDSGVGDPANSGMLRLG
jgi:hypothetical protein